jgi:hypothetical protein
LLCQKNLVLDIWGAGIKKNHMGKKLLHKMMNGNQLLGKEKEF